MLVTGGSAERLPALRVGSVDAPPSVARPFSARPRASTRFFGFDRSRRRIPFTAILQQKIRAGQSRRRAGVDQRIHERVRFSNKTKKSRLHLRRAIEKSNKELLDDSGYVQGPRFREVPMSTRKALSLSLICWLQKPKVASLRMEDVFDQVLSRSCRRKDSLNNNSAERHPFILREPQSLPELIEGNERRCS